MTDCHESLKRCDRIPKSWVTLSRQFNCMDKIADLGWQEGEDQTWDYLRGSKSNASLLASIMKNEAMVGLREGVDGVTIVGV